MSAPFGLKLNFPADVWYPLQELARKHGTDVNSMLVVGARLALEADKRGYLKIDRLQQAARAALPEKGADG